MTNYNGISLALNSKTAPAIRYRLLSENVEITDTFSAEWGTNYRREWLNTIKAPGYKRYFAYLTRDNVLRNSLVIPVKSIQSRIRYYNSSFLSVTTPATGLSSEIADYSDGALVVMMLFWMPNQKAGLIEFARVDIESIDIYEGATSESITISGHKNLLFQNMQHTLSGMSYKSLVNGIVRTRSNVDPFIRPGDIVDVGNGETITVELIQHIISVGYEYMELTEIQEAQEEIIEEITDEIIEEITDEETTPVWDIDYEALTAISESGDNFSKSVFYYKIVEENEPEQAVLMWVDKITPYTASSPEESDIIQNGGFLTVS